jgi:hypothetical protein
MADDSNAVTSELEKLLGLPPNSTKNKSSEVVIAKLAKGVLKKTDALDAQAGDLLYAEDLHPIDRMRHSISIDDITEYRVRTLSELEMVKSVAVSLLERYEVDLNQQITVSDRMYTVGPQLVDSVVKSISKIEEILSRLQKDNKEDLQRKQQEKIKKDGVKQNAKGWVEMIQEIEVDD